MKISLIGVPLDLGASRRGVDMGPSAVRVTGLADRLRRLGHDVVDTGDVPVPIPEVCAVGEARVRYRGPIAAVCRALCDRTSAARREGRIPVVLGGDHSLSIGSVSGVARQVREAGGRLGLLWFDAHGDMNTPQTSASGNIHGMPLAACLGHGPDALTRIGARFPMVDIENAALVGVRSLDDGERELIRSSGIRCFTMKDIDEHGIRAVMREAIARATDGTAGFHLSFDLDGTDPTVAPGVGTPVPGGVSYRESHTVMELVAETGKLLGLEMTEINPILDTANKTARTAVEFVESALGKRVL